MSNTASKLYKEFKQLSPTERVKFYQRIKPEIEPKDTDIVAYSVNGEPLTRTQYVTEINEAISQCERGETYTHEDVLKEIDGWK